MAADGDNLDARMEAIRLKNEELEKKHAEIMEDEEKAKRDNAIVDVNSQKNLPKDHPYDHIELDFDVKDTDKELAVNPDYKPKSESCRVICISNFFSCFLLPLIDADRRPPPRQDLLDEIPPDPVNFLREDSDDKPRPESSQNQRPPNNRNRNNNNINRNRSDRPRPERGNSNEFDASIGDSPPGPRQQNQRPRPPQQARSPQDGNSPKKAHPQQLRTERRSVPVSSDEQPGQFQQQPNRQRRPNNRSPNKEAGDRNNITVQITDGEVRSVKCKKSKNFVGRRTI